MQTAQPVKRGGRRIGAGRPKGTYKYGEPTVPPRVPAKLVGEVKALCRKAPRKLPLFVMLTQQSP
jgi:DNA polymerase V